MTAPILELRVALTTDDYARLLAFYQEALGLSAAEIWTDHGQAVLFEMGRATLEVFDERQAASVDQLEVGERVSGAVRLALQVPDVHAAVGRAVAHGARLVHEPVITPWKNLNARLESPDGMQITLFQVLDGS